jgi:RNA polymerase sigma-70 factor (ECF subfamily)
MEIPDSDLMARLAGGEDLALNRLMERWASRVAAFLYRMTGRRETAADLAQETFVKLYQARDRYRADGNFSTYLFAIASNLAKNHTRWRMRHPALSLDASPDDSTSPILQLVDPQSDPRETAQKMEQMTAVAAAFRVLPPDLREAMSLFIYEGMGYAEIGVLMGCSAKAVETRIYRARQILKEQLKGIRS